MGPSIRARSFAVFAVAAVLCCAAPARATDCTPPNHLSPCIDSEELWFAPPSSRWISIGIARPQPFGQWSFGVGDSVIIEPVVLEAPSPDPQGREIRVVEGAANTTLGAALALGRGLSASFALPYTAYQLGSGVQGLTSQSGPPIRRIALRDPRLGIAFVRRLPLTPLEVWVQTSTDVAFPLGDADALAGGRSFVAAPAAAIEARYGRLELASEIGLRARMTSELAGARVGSDFGVSLGGGVVLGSTRRFTVRAEGWIRPSLVAQDHVLPDGTQVDTVSIPAEWMLSFDVVPDSRRELTFGVGGGTGLPLSTERRTLPDGSSSETSFEAVGTPLVRVVGFVRWAPRAHGG